MGSIPSDGLYQNRHFIRTCESGEGDRTGKWGGSVRIEFNRKIGLIARVYRSAEHILPKHSLRLVSIN